MEQIGEEEEEEKEERKRRRRRRRRSTVPPLGEVRVTDVCDAKFPPNGETVAADGLVNHRLRLMRRLGYVAILPDMNVSH